MSTHKFEPHVGGISTIKRELLESLLREEGIELQRTQTIPRRETSDPPPLSFAQQRLWFLQQLDPRSAAYNVPRAVRLTGPLNVSALRQSLSEVVRRHEVLRTNFTTVDEQPVQIVHASRPVALPVFDLSDLPEAEREASIQALFTKETSRPFDLANDSLLRASLVRAGDEDHVILFTLHHIVSDGWSSGVLINELVALYDAYSHDRPSPLLELPVQYADYAVWQRQQLQGEALAEQLAYWGQKLRSTPVLELPADRPRPKAPGTRGASYPFALSKPLTDALNELSRREGTTLFMTLLAAFKVLLARYTGEEDISIGVPIAGRRQVETEQLIGFFINTLVMRTDLSGEPSFRELLGRVREVAVGAYAHQELPFERIVEELQPERNAGSQPFFNVMFVYQNMPASSSHPLRGLTMSEVEMSEETAVRSDIDFYLWEGETVRGSFVYSTDLFDESTIAQMSSRLVELLEEITRAPEVSVADLLASSKPEPLAISLTAVADEKVPFSYHQERMWFIDQFENGNVYESAPTYHNIPLLLQLMGDVDTEVLESSLNEIVQRHAILRTRFIADEGKGWQVITPSERLELKVDQGGLELALTAAREPFALDQDLPIRARLFRQSATESLLLLTVHHIVADRPSLRLIAAELSEIYNARLEGHGASLPELPVQYAGYAKGQQNLTEADFEPLWFYWKWQLRGQLAALKLPEDRPRPAIHTYTAARETFTLDATVVSRLGEDQFAALLAAFKVLLHRYARQDEIVVGTSEPCRTQPEVANLVGPFANLVVLRSDLGGNPSFSKVMQRVQQTLDQARAHQELPFDKLVQLLNPEKDMSRTALFDVLFQFEDEAAPVFSLGRAEAQQIDTNFGYGKYDLNLLVHRNAAGFSVNAVYNSDIYDAWNIRQMLRHFLTLIDAFAVDPEQGIDDVTFLSAAEEQQQLSGWNNTGASYPADKTIHELFAAQAARTPDAIAVTFGDEHVTYRELDERANRLAHYLRRCGVGPNKLVALCLNKSPEMIVSLLAVLKAGAGYLPLDASNPAERLQFVMEDSGAAHLITTAALAGKVSSSATVLVDADRGAIALEPATAPDSVAGPQDLAYCIYTSGSTGKPKGALIEHRNVVRLMVNDKLQFSFTDADVWTMFHSYSFDFSVWEMYGALLYGGRLVIVPEQVSKDPALFLDLVVDEQVTVLNQTPTAFYNFASLDQGQSLALRYVIFGGEALRPALLREWRAAHREVKLINMYGITETTVHVTFKEIDDEHVATDTSNIGVPIPTTTTYIFDDELRLLPVGVPGEICVGGGGVCRGYLGRDELTRRKFVVNPYKPEEKIYRSGDLGKLLPSGEMVYLGRSDNQVQIRGFRVEPGEVQSQLLTHPAITRAEVIAKTMHHGAVELVAYVVASGEVDVSELRTHVASALPHYMVPSAFVFIDRIPLTPNGKVDQRALPEPDQSRPELGADFVAPRTQTEEILASMWADVLGLTRVGIHDNFFDLGGHSLLATQVVSRIRKLFGIELPLRDVFEGPTVAELSRNVEAAMRAGRGLDEPPIERVSREQELPLSFAQQRLWFLDSLEPGTSTYNIPFAVRLTGPLAIGALAAALNEVVRRHEVLRTSFTQINGRPTQVIAPEAHVTLEVENLEELPSAERDAQARRLAEEEARRPFDLSTGPLVRARLLQMGDEEHIVLFTMHHIVSDGWSMGVLVREVNALYEAFASGRPSPLSELPIQYADFAVWQQQWLARDSMQPQLEYWKQRLADAPSSLPLPADSPRATAESDKGAEQTVLLSQSLSERLRSLSGSEGASLFMTLLAAFKALLSRYTQQYDIVVGMPIANRDRLETEGLIGFFVNTLVLRTDLSGDPTFAELLGRVRETTLGAYAHQNVPFERIVEELQPEREGGNNPLFNVLFNFVNTPQREHGIAGLGTESVRLADPQSQFPLTIVIEDIGHRLAVRALYQAELFTPERIASVLEQFEYFMQQIVAKPDAPLSFYSLVTPEARALLPDATVELEEPRFPRAHEMFMVRAQERPDAVALSQGARNLSYGELAQAAERLAQSLLSAGVTRGEVVAVMGSRCFGTVTAMLGVLMSGGVLLNLDRDLPAERQQLMLRESGAKHLLHVGEPQPEDGWIAQDESLRVGLVDAETGQCVDHRTSVSGRDTSSGAPDDPAYIFFTSGTTGKPKGVLGCHKGLSHFLQWQRETFSIGPEDRAAQLTALSFDVVLRDILTPLTSGATLCLPDREDFGPDGVIGWLEREKITMLHAVPSLAQFWLSHASRRDAGRNGPRYVFFAGEPLFDALVRRWREVFPMTEVVNLYGPTETTLAKCFYRVSPEDMTRGVQPVGWPMPHAQALVLTEGNRLCGVNEPGEVFIRTPFRSLGYINAAEENESRFVPNSFREDPADLLYRTGDRGCYRPDGSLELTGRIDNQVKVHGVRIEPEEIEEVLSAHPGVSKAAVVAREDEPGEKYLAAYVVPDEKYAPAFVNRVRYRLPNNLAVVQFSKSETDYLYREIFQLQAYIRHGISIEDGDCILDVGANIGLFTLFAQQLAQDTKVYAFEPTPATFELLSSNVSLYGSNVKLFNFGLSDSDKEQTFTFFPRFSFLTGAYADPETERSVVKSYVVNQQKDDSSDLQRIADEADDILDERFATETFTARLRSLSGVIAEEGIERIDLLKINVEKSELDVLRGLAEEDWKKVRRIVMEVDVAENLTAITELLAARGFDFVVEQDVWLVETPLCYVYAMRPGSGELIREQERGAHLRSLPPLPEPFLNRAELKRFAATRLPSYMVPGAFQILDELPLSANGKLDRRALPIPDRSGAEEEVYVAPRTAVEESLADIWAEVLGVDRVGVHDNFFDLGGHSLVVTRMLARVRRDFRVELPVRRVFEQPTIAELAHSIEAAVAVGPGGEQALVIYPTSREGRLPISFAQEFGFDLARREGRPPYYARVIEFTGRLNVAAIGHALSEIVRRHESLRTTFVESGTGWEQVVNPARPIALPLVDLTANPEAEREPEASRLARELMFEPFDLERGPVFRAVLLKLDDERHQLVYTVLHLVCDFWSLEIFNREVAVLYEAFCHGRLSPLAEPPIQYVDFTVWQHNWFRGEVREAHVSFWKQYLEGSPEALLLSTDHPRPRHQTFRSSEQMGHIRREVQEALRGLSRREEVTFYTVLLAAFEVMMYRYTGQTDIVLGAAVAGRNRVELENVTGQFTNTIVRRTDLSGDPTFRELVGRVHEGLARSYAFHEMPFSELMKELNRPDNPSYPPIVQNVFLFGHVDESDASGFSELDARVWPLDIETLPYDIVMRVNDAPHGLTISLDYNADLFEPETMRRMIRHYATLLESIVRDCDEHISALTMDQPVATHAHVGEGQTV